MMESVDFMDRYLDPPEYPKNAVCLGCGDVFDADDLNDDYLCKNCEKEDNSDDGV
jgi:hypothetical protein